MEGFVPFLTECGLVVSKMRCTIILKEVDTQKTVASQLLGNNGRVKGKAKISSVALIGLQAAVSCSNNFNNA